MFRCHTCLPGQVDSVWKNSFVYNQRVILCHANEHTKYEKRQLVQFWAVWIFPRYCTETARSDFGALQPLKSTRSIIAASVASSNK